MSHLRKVIAVGNSFAVVLDRQVCRSLRIDSTTRLEMSLDGDDIRFRRASPVRGISQAGRIAFYSALHALMRSLDNHGLTRLHFERLSHDGTRLNAFLGDVSVRGLVDPVTVERLQRCLARRQSSDESWDSTIEAVLAEVPDVRPPDDAGS